MTSVKKRLTIIIGVMTVVKWFYDLSPSKK